MARPRRLRSGKTSIHKRRAPSTAQGQVREPGLVRGRETDHIGRPLQQLPQQQRIGAVQASG